MRIAILTSALNEASSLPDLTSRIQSVYDLFLVDDGSSDCTGDIAEGLNYNVLKHSVNLGQGYAFITGIKTILADKASHYDYIVYLDADGQHNPSEIPKLIQKAEEEGLDVVVGSRILGSNHRNAPFFRKNFLPVFTWIINRLTGYTLTDALSGYRAFRVSSLKRISHIFDHMLEPRYLAAEMFIRFAKAGLKIGEVPICMKDRMHGKSHKGFIRYGYGILKAIVITFLDKNYRTSIR